MGWRYFTQENEANISAKMRPYFTKKMKNRTFWSLQLMGASGSQKFYLSLPLLPSIHKALSSSGC
jgi:hypothetical protein